MTVELVGYWKYLNLRVLILASLKDIFRDIISNERDENLLSRRHPSSGIRTVMSQLTSRQQGPAGYFIQISDI
jgi:hypothetical protein